MRTRLQNCYFKHHSSTSSFVDACSSSPVPRLTTFVLRSFAKAAKYIYIDQAKMAETKQWVVEKQQDNGCFQMVGSLFNQRMKVSHLFTQKWP